MRTYKILQGLGVGPGSATERWPYRKFVRKSASFRKKNKITWTKYFFLDIPSSYAKIFGGNLFQPCEFLQSGWKGVGEEKKKRKVGENNGQLRFVRHHGRRMQARMAHASRLGQKSEDNGQLRFVHHHGWRMQACLDQHFGSGICIDHCNHWHSLSLWPTSGILPKLKFCFPQYFGIIKRNTKKKQKW